LSEEVKEGDKVRVDFENGKIILIGPKDILKSRKKKE